MQISWLRRAEAMKFTVIMKCWPKFVFVLCCYLWCVGTALATDIVPRNIFKYLCNGKKAGDNRTAMITNIDFKFG